MAALRRRDACFRFAFVGSMPKVWRWRTPLCMKATRIDFPCTSMPGRLLPITVSVCVAIIILPKLLPVVSSTCWLLAFFSSRLELEQFKQPGMHFAIASLPLLPSTQRRMYQVASFRLRQTCSCSGRTNFIRFGGDRCCRSRNVVTLVERVGHVVGPKAPSRLAG